MLWANESMPCNQARRICTNWEAIENPLLLPLPRRLFGNYFMLNIDAFLVFSHGIAAFMRWEILLEMFHILVKIKF